MPPVREANPDAPVVAAERLTKIFRDFWMRPRARAVDGVTFEIRRREIFGLLGPNGSGKSTTIKMILGLLRPNRGRLAVFGKPATDVAVKKRIGYLPEESYLYGFLNARETLDYYGKLFGLDRRERSRRTEELLEMVGLTGAQYRPVREYSKGMQRRIGIAQALINDPEFLILDEPTTGLDPLGTRQVKDLILELGRRGKTVLLSSHLLADVEDVVDRMVILYGGQIREEGKRDDVLIEHSRTTIETDAIDERTIAEIDELLRSRTNGQVSVRNVAHPRQKLEDKFLEIVRVARTENLATSGAEAEGAVAEFLKHTPATGGNLIADLVAEGAAEEPPPAEIETDSTEQPAARDDVIESLVNEESPEQEKISDEPAAPVPNPDVETDAAEPAEPEDISVEQLLAPDADEPEQDAEPEKPAVDASEVDLGVIGSLMESDNDPERDK